MAEIVQLKTKCACNLCPASSISHSAKNPGRKYFHCPKEQNRCKFFGWGDSRDYEYGNDRFKNGSCFRCGYYNYEVTDCEREFDFFGNLIKDTEEYNSF